MTSEIGFAATAPPTARAARGSPMAAATSRQVAKRPNGILRSASQTLIWKFVLGGLAAVGRGSCLLAREGTRAPREALFDQLRQRRANKFRDQSHRILLRGVGLVAIAVAGAEGLPGACSAHRRHSGSARGLRFWRVSHPPVRLLPNHLHTDRERAVSDRTTLRGLTQFVVDASHAAR